MGYEYLVIHNNLNDLQEVEFLAKVKEISIIIINDLKESD